MKMNKDPDLIISISGSHESKGIVSAIVAEALKNRGVSSISHLSYDEDTFEQMSKIINETEENSLFSATVLLIEYEEDFIENIHSGNSENNNNDEQETLHN